MQRRTGLILALDVTEKKRAIEIAGAVSDHIDAVKVNYPLILSCGMDIIDELSRIRPVICDFKVADIPNTNMLIAREVGKHGASGLICQTFPGVDSLRACKNEFVGDVFAVTEMSHPGAVRFMQPQLEEMVKATVEADVAGVIAPATRPDRIRLARSLIGDRLILSPGVGAQGGSARDTISAGADFIIVGRSIYGTDRPEKVAMETAEGIADLL